MPSTTGLVCAAIVGLVVFGIAWWNRANQRLDALAAPRPAEEYDPVAEAMRILEAS